MKNPNGPSVEDLEFARDCAVDDYVKQRATMKFTLTDQHIKLIRRFYVGWQHCEFGAPEIDPKRPYGNSAVENDIHEILTGETIGMVDSKRDELTNGETARYKKLHRETATALQIVLSTGTFVPGVYECDDYSVQWRLFYRGRVIPPHLSASA